MPRTLPFPSYSIHYTLSSYLSTFSDSSRRNSRSAHHNLANHRRDTFLSTKQYKKYAQIRVFHVRSSLFRIPQFSMIRPTQNCTDLRSHIKRRTHCIVTHANSTAKSTKKHFFVSTGMETQSILSRYRCCKRSGTVHLVVNYYAPGWRQRVKAPVKIFFGPP